MNGEDMDVDATQLIGHAQTPIHSNRYHLSLNASEDESSADEATAEVIPVTNDKSRSFLTASDGELYLHGVARSARTSNARFSDSFDSPYTRETFREALTPTFARTAELVSSLQESYASRFLLWHMELDQGFTLIFHGVGSKRNLLNAFGARHLAHFGTVVVTNGFSPAAGIVDLLSAAEDALGIKNAKATTSKPSGVTDRNEARALIIRQKLSEDDTKPLFLIVHSLDSSSLRMAKSKNVLALLASHSKIHLLASVDHVRAMLLFTSSAANASVAEDLTNTEDDAKPNIGFAFVHHHTPTFAPLLEEVEQSGTLSTIFPPSVYPSFASSASNMSVASQMQGTLSVVASVNDNARKLFKHLAERQVAAYEALSTDVIKAMDLSKAALTPPGTTPPIAVSQNSLLTFCRDNFLASALNQMISLLAEFKDHEIVLSSPTAPEDVEVDAGEAGDWFWIRMKKNTLEGVVERIE